MGKVSAARVPTSSAKESFSDQGREFIVRIAPDHRFRRGFGRGVVTRGVSQGGDKGVERRRHFAASTRLAAASRAARFSANVVWWSLRRSPLNTGYQPRRATDIRQHKRRMGSVTPDQMLAAETKGLDIRFHAGAVDASELPSSYKKADRVIQQIAEYGLADVVDCIDPYGCIMAGDLPPVWQKGKRVRR